MATKKPTYRPQPTEPIDFDKLMSFMPEGVSAPAAPVEPRGMARTIADTGLSFGRGAVQGVRLLSDVAGADNAVSGALRSVEDFIGGLQSAQAKQDQQEVARILKEAENKGVLDQVVAGVKAFSVAPGQLVAQAAGTSIPTLATALIPGAGPMAAAARLGAGAAMGGAQGVGAVKSSIYDEVEQDAIARGLPKDEAARLASEAQAYSGKNAGQIALGAGLGVLAGTTGVERVVGGLRNGVTAAAPGVMRRVVTGAASEALPEMAQGGQEKYAANVAVFNAGGERDPWAGVVAGGTMEGLAGAAMGGAFGLPRPQEQPAAPPPPAGDALRAEKLPERGPLTRGVNAAVEAAAKKADENPAVLGLPWNQRWEPEGGFSGQAPLYVFPDGSAATLSEATDVLEQTIAQRNIERWMERSPRPMPEPEAQALAQAAQAKTGNQMTVLPIPDGSGFTVVPAAWVNHPSVADYIEQAQAAAAVEAERQAAIEAAAAAPVERAPRTPRAEPVLIDPAAPNMVEQYVARMAATNTPAARAFVQDFRAGRISPDEVLQLAMPAAPVSAGEDASARIAKAAAQAPEPQPTDILMPSGRPFRNSRAAQTVAAREDGTVVEGAGGWAVRPKSQTANETTTASTPAAEAATPTASPAAEPAAVVPGAGAAAVEADGVEQPARAKAMTAKEYDAMTADKGEAFAMGHAAQRKGFSMQPPGVLRSKADQQAFEDGWLDAKRATTAPVEAAGVTAQPAAAPDRVKINTRFGNAVFVDRADLESDKPRMRHFTSTGKSLGIIVRENLDPTGELRRADAKETAENPLFNVIGTKEGRVFASKAVATRELNTRGLQDSHEVVADGPGFVVKRKADANQEPERRVDMARRKRVEQMSPEEMRRELLTDDLTGLNNGRWLRENQDNFSHIIAFDADSLKWVNDNMGHDAGDMLLKAWGAALQAATPNAARSGGDEFFALANGKAEAQRIADAVESALSQAVITASAPEGDVTITGLGASYGIAQDKKAADEALNQHKRTREQAGTRAGRGEPPPGTTRSAAQGEQDQANRGGGKDNQAGQGDVAPTNERTEQPAPRSASADAQAAPEEDWRARAGRQARESFAQEVERSIAGSTPIISEGVAPLALRGWRDAVTERINRWGLVESETLPDSGNPVKRFTLVKGETIAHFYFRDQDAADRARALAAVTAWAKRDGAPAESATAQPQDQPGAAGVGAVASRSAPADQQPEPAAPAPQPAPAQSGSDGARRKAFTFKIKPANGGFVIESDDGGGMVMAGRPNGPGVMNTVPARTFATDVAARKYMADKGMTEAPATEPAPSPSSANTLVTDDAAERARAIIRAKLRGNTLNSGIDPELLQAGITLAAYHVERGARKFAAYARAMVNDMGDSIKPYLQSWYMAMRNDPAYAALKPDMDKASAVEDLDVDEALAATAATQADQPADIDRLVRVPRTLPEEAAAARPAIGAQWDAMTLEQRHAVAAKAGWSTAKGNVNPQGRAISLRQWGSQIDTTRARLGDVISQSQVVATHKDPGQPAEPVTQTVVKEAIAKAARNEDRPRSEMRAEALRLIDAAMEKAKPDDDGDVLMHQATAPGAKMNASQIAEYQRLSGSSREKYMQRLAKETAETHQRAADKIGHVRIKVPGDGEFKILNTRESLAAFRRKVETSPGFKDKLPRYEAERVNGYGTKQQASAPFGVESGSGGKQAAFSNMVEDGDMEAALDYAEATGIDPKAAKLTNTLRERLDKFMRDRDMAAQLAAGEQRQAAELAPAAPASEATSEPWKLTREQAAKDYPGDEYDRMLNRHGDLGDLSYTEVDRRARINSLGERKLWAKTRAQLEHEGKDAVKAARGDRAAINKLKSTPEFASWRIKSMSATGKQAIADAERLARDYLAVHKDRVQEALMEGKDVPAEVLADYPDLKRPASKAAPPAPAPVSSREGQMNLSYRGSRIALLKAMNEQLRRVAPGDAWADANIEGASNAELDGLQDAISAALVAATRGPAAVNPLRAELEGMSGADLRAIMERMNLAGARMLQEERIAALLAEDPAEVRAAMQAVAAPAPSQVTTDVTYHYTDGEFGMTSGGSFTKDKTRWLAFDGAEARRMAEGSIKPYGATRLGVFVGAQSGKRLAAPSQAAPSATAPATEPDALTLTPKQYHDAKLRAMAQANDTTLAEVREMYDTDGGRAANEQEWVERVVDAAQAGTTLTRVALDKLLELRPTARLPETAIPEGYQRPEARKAEAEAAEAKRDDRRTLKQRADAMLEAKDEPSEAKRKAAEAVRQSVVKRTNANSAMVWQIIHEPSGEAISGPRGTYPGRGMLAGTSTIGQLGWKTRAEATAALAELNRVANGILGAKSKEAEGLDRNSFTLNRAIGNNTLEEVTFQRGEYITYRIGEGGRQAFGEIDGISHARREFSVGGLWYPFGFAYKTDRPAPAPNPNSVPLSSVVDAVNKKYGAGLGPADAVSVVDAFKGTMRAVYDGTATLGDYQAAYRRVRDASAVKAELGKLTKDELVRTFSIMAGISEKKETLIDSAYKSMLRGFALGKQYGPSGYLMTRGGLENYEKQKAEALDAIVENHTAEDLAAFAAEVKAEREQEAAKRAAAVEAIKNPKTLDEYRRFMSYHTRDGKSTTEVRLSMLTPEQRADFDLMLAEESRGRRKVTTDDQRTQVRVAGQTVDGNIIATKHTKKGHDLFVVQLAERVSREDYETLNTGAKKIGGYYSSFRGGGAIPGFQFTTREQAQAFVTLAGGDASAAKEAAQERRDAYSDDRSQTAAERLTEMAEAMDAAADESLARERKANTARRARFAAAAEAGAREAKAMAKTMRNVAEALTSGAATFLDRVRTKTQVQLLQTYVANAKDEELRAKYPTYAEQEKRKGQPPTMETADYAQFPEFTAYRSDLASLGRQLQEVDGTKKIGDQLMKVADDVSDAFTAWVKEPGHFAKVATFSNKSGGIAAMPSKDAAERAIARSGYRGKAIPWSVKRGEWTVIMSPSEAMARGVWQGDGDKRITLDADFAADMVEKMGRANRRGAKVSVPWQFERAYERRKALARMGIETPAEFRAALREFIGLREQAAEADRIKMLERAMVGKAKDGLDFFPTPESVADEMVSAADIQPDMAVLEPSAGMGHIADRIRAAGAEPDVIERSGARRELLQEKGYSFAPVSDFLALKPREFFTFGDVFRAPDGREGIMRGNGGMGSGRVRLDDESGNTLGLYDRDELVGVRHRGTASGYDRIVMNPPFSDGRDIEHVRHAYTLLKPGGRIVALMGESAFTNQNKRATEFREWLESVGGTDEKLPEGSFMDSSLPVNTGANARMVVIDKPSATDATAADDTVFSRPDTPWVMGTRAVTMEDARAAVAAIRQMLPKAPPINVLEKINQAPKDLAARIRAAGAEDLYAVFYDGEIYVFPRNIPSIEKLQQVVAHHEIRHYGMRSILGPNMGPVMLAMWESNPNVRRLAQDQIDRGLAKSRVLAVEEALADMGPDDLVKLGAWDKLVSAVRRWLRSMALRMRAAGMPTVADMLDPKGWTDRDIASFIGRAEDVSRVGSAMFRAGGMAFQRAWHGTPHRGIDKFSTDKIGTGEGAQAYGWGLYFASKKEIAEWYRNSLSDASVDLNDLKPAPKGSTAENLVRLFSKNRTLDADDLRAAGVDPENVNLDDDGEIAVSRFIDEGFAAQDSKDLGDGKYLFTFEDGSSFLDDQGDIKAVKPVRGQLYEVEIPEDTEMLLWDKPLSEQPAKVRRALDGLKIQRLGDANPASSGEALYKGLAAELMGGRRASGSDTARLAAYFEPASRALAARGIKGIKYLDGTSRGAGTGSYNYVIFSGDDVAIERAVFSRPGLSPEAVREAVPPAVMQWLDDRTTSQRGFNRWWHRTVGTQFHKAKVNKEFGRAYYAVQDFMKDVSRIATLAADKAPDMLAKVETLGDLRTLAPTLLSPAGYKQRKADIQAASAALFDGTLRYTRDENGKAVKADAESGELGGIVWTPDELRERGLSDRAIKMYEQSREAIDQSLDSMLAADIYRQVTVMDPSLLAANPTELNALLNKVRELAASETPADAVQAVRDALKARLDDVQTALDGQPNQHTPGLLEKRKELRSAQAAIAEKFNRIADLKAAGYAPLMRFGPYAVDAIDGDGQRVFFGLYESQAEANKAARKFRQDGLRVTQSVVPQKQFEALKGVSPETAMLFAEMLGVDKNEAMQAWLKNAVAEQSALKRHIRRKGIEGFDEDGARVLAAFVTSNARAASRALHTARITDAVENIRQGDVQDEARALAEYVNNPQEEAQAIRSLLFMQYIGGSIASALVNITQTFGQTFPFLSQFGGPAKAGSRVAAAMKAALSKTIEDKELASAIAKAERDGTLSPQEVFQLQAEASRSLGSNLYVRSILTAWGSMFQLAEQYNRRVAFIAAYNTAKAEGMADPMAFAENAVDETQSVFNKGNRPDWARGAVGATLFTFKTFSIQYLEFLKRLATAGKPRSPERKAGQRAAGLALVAMLVMAGAAGLPGMEDLEDVIDTVAQGLGYNWTTADQRDRWLDSMVGEVASEIIQRGISGVPGVPFDVSGRLGMPNLLPGTALLKQSETRKEDQVLEVFGVAGSFVRDTLKAAPQLLEGDVVGAMAAGGPIAIRNIIKAVDSYETGMYRDSRGRNVTEVNELEAALKGIGLQPAVVARAQREIGNQIELRNLYRAVKEDITDEWARARFADDMEGIQKARDRLKRWNDRNPEAPIIIRPETIASRVRNMRRSKAERTIANAPRPLRAQTAEALE